MAPAPDSGRLSGGRKALYALLILLLLLGAAEGLARLAVADLPPPPARAPSLVAHIEDVRARARRARYGEREGELPGAVGPEVLLRVAGGSPGAEPFPGPGGHYRRLKPAALPAGGQVLLFGASAAYGDGVTFAQTFAQLSAARLQQRLNRPELRLLNLARPAWELQSVAALVQRLLGELPQAPAAVVLLSGNNEFLSFPFPGVGNPPWQRLGLYRWLSHQARRRGWLRPPPGWDYGFFKEPRWEPIPLDFVARRIWRGLPGVGDASYWPKVLEAQLEGYQAGLSALVAELRRRKIPLVLIPPPQHLSLFVGGIQPQPVTYAPVGQGAYGELSTRLSRALAAGDRAAVRALGLAYPDGPLQRYLEAQWLEQAGKYDAARAAYGQAREQMMGVLAGIPQISALMREQAGDGVTVLDPGQLYPAGVSPRRRSRELFNDACHLSPRGHRELAQMLSEALAPLLR